MFNPATSWQSDAEYHTFLFHVKARLSSSQRLRRQRFISIWKKMSSLKLDPVLDAIAPLYSKSGRPAKNQSLIIRSMILFTLLLGKTGVLTNLW